jgi:hypothetical protein
MPGYVRVDDPVCWDVGCKLDGSGHGKQRLELRPISRDPWLPPVDHALRQA